jgi:hypothetical protein
VGANRVEAPSLTVPAGTPVATPVSTTLYAQRARIVRMEVKVPPGPSGLVGFRFDHSNAQVIPKVPGTWIVTDNEVVQFDLDDLQPWPDWRLVAYNTDVFDHTLYVVLWLDDRVPVVESALTLVNIE